MNLQKKDQEFTPSPNLAFFSGFKLVLKVICIGNTKNILAVDFLKVEFLVQPRKI